LLRPEGSSKEVAKEEEEMDLVVDGDDTTVYGPAQYTEEDVAKAQEAAKARLAASKASPPLSGSDKDVEVKQE
jgi:hypothetical protein